MAFLSITCYTALVLTGVFLFFVTAEPLTHNLVLFNNCHPLVGCAQEETANL